MIQSGEAICCPLDVLEIIAKEGMVYSSIRLVKGSNSGCQVANINQFCFSKYNIAFNTLIFSFDAKEMLLTKKNDLFHLRQIFGIRQNVTGQRQVFTIAFIKVVLVKTYRLRYYKTL